jgi:dTDP-glucose pyrophosphorylase
MDSVNIVIPMAGYGFRFSEAGYTDPKPFIPVFGSPMISWVVKNIGIKANYIFVIRKEFEDTHNANDYLKSIAPNCKIITVDKVTEGAACTVLLTKEYINNNNPLIIINSDQFIEFNDGDNAYNFVSKFLHDPREKLLSGKISTFDGKQNPKWSYVKTNENGIITEVREKDPFSDYATTGLYIWRYGCEFVKFAEQMILKNIRVNNEFYVVPVFNEAIASGLNFGIEKCKKMWGIGVPEDLKIFLNEYPLKLAICYSGEPRDFLMCYENHKKNLFQHHTVDIYVHAWKCLDMSQKATPPEIGVDNTWRTKIPIVRNSDYISTLKPYRYIIEERDMEPQTPMMRQTKMNYGISRVMNLVDTNKKYDFIIRLRPDFYFLDKIQFSIITKTLNSIWVTINIPEIEGQVLDPTKGRGITDFFAISDNVNSLINFYNMITDTAMGPESIERENKLKNNSLFIYCIQTQGHLYRNVIKLR